MDDNQFPKGTKPEDTRAIDVSIDIAAAPGDIWPYLSTSEGLSAWYVGADFEGQEVGARCTLTFGPGMAVPATVHAFEVEEKVALGPPPDVDSPRVEEYRIEKNAAGGCTVRIVNWGFGEGADWDKEYDAVKKGWLGFLGKLKEIVEHFSSFGAPRKVQFMAWGQDLDEAQAKLAAAFGPGAKGAKPGDEVTLTPSFAPALTGQVVSADELGLRLRQVNKTGGLLFGGFVERYAGSAFVTLGLTLFGDAKDDGDALQDAWGGWFADTFPSPQS